MLYFSICTALVDFLQDHATPYGFWPALPVNIEGIIYMQDLPHLRALYSMAPHRSPSTSEEDRSNRMHSDSSPKTPPHPAVMSELTFTLPEMGRKPFEQICDPTPQCGADSSKMGNESSKILLPGVSCGFPNGPSHHLPTTESTPVAIERQPRSRG